MPRQLQQTAGLRLEAQDELFFLSQFFSRKKENSLNGAATGKGRPRQAVNLYDDVRLRKVRYGRKKKVRKEPAPNRSAKVRE
jgi:hypothetical protein